MSAAATPKPPVIGSALEAAIWLIVKAAADKVQIDPRKLNLLLYLGQCRHMAEHDGRSLFPASFVADAEGPVEPNVTLALQMGLNAPQEPTLDEHATRQLEDVWRRFGALPAVGLMKLIAADGVWQPLAARAPGAEIQRASLAKALARPKSPPSQVGAPARVAPPPAERPRALDELLRMAKAEAGRLDAARAADPGPAGPVAGQPVAGEGRPELPKFLLDGRSVARWAPRRRIEKPAQGSLSSTRGETHK